MTVIEISVVVIAVFEVLRALVVVITNLKQRSAIIDAQKKLEGLAVGAQIGAALGGAVGILVDQLTGKKVATEKKQRELFEANQVALKKVIEDLTRKQQQAAPGRSPLLALLSPIRKFIKKIVWRKDAQPDHRPNPDGKDNAGNGAGA